MMSSQMALGFCVYGGCTMRVKAYLLFSSGGLLVAAALIQQPKTQNVFKLHRPSEDFAQTAARQSAPSRAEATKQRLTESYGSLPLSYEANQGQTSNEVKFLSRGGGYTLFLTSNEAVLDL